MVEPCFHFIINLGPIQFMISLTFNPLTPWPLAFLISEFSSTLPFQQPLIHPILFRTHPVAHLSLFDNLFYADALPYAALSG